MSPYGKLVESEQEKLEARRKTRRRVAIMSLSAVVLVGVVVAAVLGTTLAHNNDDHDDNNRSSNNNVGLSASVKAVCDVTLYKDACYDSLGRVVQSTSGQAIKPEDLFRMSLKVALDEVAGAADKYFSGEKGAFEDLMMIGDNRTMEAFNNCKQLLDLAVDHLNDSLSSGQSSVLELFDDLQTWLTASGTYQQTCIDGLEEAKESLKSRVRSYLKNSTELTGNSLAIITWLNKAASTLNLRRRRLLTLQDDDNEAPAWLHQKDRKLLASDKDVKQKADIVVAKDGSGKYRTISEALKHVPEKSNKRTVIYVKKGVYYENVRVEKKKWNVMMIGDGMSRTIVSGSLNFVDGTPTFSSATFAVFGRNFMARDMGFRNTAGPEKHQAVALMTSADQAVYYRCQIDAFQDTLYVHAQRQFYRECNIYGTVDFIFGNSAVVIQNCNILPKVPMLGQKNTITAQGKIDPNMNTGISIQNCRISPFGNLSSVQTYLGRPWKNYSTTVFMKSSMGDLIDRSGWLPWVGNSAPDTIFYAEFRNFGPGASTKGRVTWKGLRTITAKEANRFTVKTFLQGDRWIPGTSTPYKSYL
ncbi:putative pectinesterase/pectinesterase inhibitor 24 [Prosopis cineraria]|uniref:putative pectinesterase/pectinesterase inhibitor 24 n=1 Tax=Prosopis cineraria TaxID=364024 RepID=UPI00240FDE33|nr:putative pectinesterase/pectinesterase inhibitor 24 [Prosopis cineraria]